MPRVLIADKLEPAGIDVDNRPGLKGDDLAAALRAADAGFNLRLTKPADPNQLLAVLTRLRTALSA